VNLETLVARVAEGLAYVDQNTNFVGSSARTGMTYLPGVPSMTEPQLCAELVEWWKAAYASDFDPSGTCAREVPYPALKGASCDIVFRSPAGASAGPEWAIELKRIQFIGDNGKNNDFNVQKALSPYLKDRSLIHDILRMRRYPLASRHAVVGYAFSYSFQSCEVAAGRHPDETGRVNEIRAVCRKNDRANGVLDPAELVDFADLLFRREDLVSDHRRQPFSDLWRHPCGGNGLVFGWEVKWDPSVVMLGQDSHQRSIPIELDLGMSS